VLMVPQPVKKTTARVESQKSERFKTFK
jgi:hypothetical protein